MAQTPLLAPNPLNNTTSGVPWSPSYTGVQTTTRTVGSTSSGARPRFVNTPNGLVRVPTDLTNEEADQYVAGWDAYMAKIEDLINNTSGFEREKFIKQYEDAEKGRENAVAMARLQSETSRYGVDVGRENLLTQLEQNDRQFAANHALEIEKFGLDTRRFGVEYAKAATDYLSNPDRFAQATDFISMAGRAMEGLGPTPYGSQTYQAQPKTEADFAVLAGGGAPRDAGSGGTPFANPAGNESAFHGAIQPSAGESGDERLKALTSVFKAVPPSPGEGLDNTDYAVLTAARALMSTPLKPGTLARMRPDQKSIYSSYVKRSG